MFDKNLQDFLDRNDACSDGVDRLQDRGVETLEQAWEKASDEDLIWAVTREGVMNAEQRRLFLVMVLESIEDKLTDSRSLNILTKLRINEPITDDDRNSASAAMEARAARAAAWEAWEAACAAAWASARAAWFAASEEAWEARAAACAAARASAWAAWFAASEEAMEARAARAARAASEAASEAARAAQAKWVRENFKLQDLHTK